MKLLHRVFIDLLFVALAMLFSRSSYICLVKYLNFFMMYVFYGGFVCHFIFHIV